MRFGLSIEIDGSCWRRVQRQSLAAHARLTCTYPRSLQVVLAEWICAHLESSRVRKVSGLVLQSPPTPLKVYELFIEKLMDAQTSKFVGTKGAARVPIELNRLFEQAISEYGRNAVDVWLWYATCHLRCADFTMAAAIYDRALKMLRQDLHGDFTARYQEAVQVEAV